MRKLASPRTTVSVVSHGHGAQILQLMRKLETHCLECVGQVILTINVPEPRLFNAVNSQAWAFKLTITQNNVPKGFGANHNAAFRQSRFEYFCVLNPDIDFDRDPFPDLITHAGQAITGCAFPVQLNEVGQMQDYARRLPTPPALVARYLGRKNVIQAFDKPEWVNGAFMLFPAKVFDKIGGFDERYFMYCEDVDICLRLQLAGFKLSQSDAVVVHAAQRNTRVNFRHFAWHIVSLIRLWSSVAYWEFSSRPRVVND